MIPDGLIKTDLKVTEDIESTKAYKISDTSIQGFVDDIEALKQAIYKVLNTEKYEYQIYSFSYGIELENLIGKDPVYVRVELIRRIEDCLLQDERVTRVGNFQYTTKGDELLCKFDVESIYGELTITKEVNV